MVSPRDQRYLHSFFRLAEELTDADALSHRRAVSVERPSLPQSAGRALRHLAHPRYEPATLVGRRRRIVVYPLVRPQVDTHKLGRALLWAALEQAGAGMRPKRVPTAGGAGHRGP